MARPTRRWSSCGAASLWWLLALFGPVSPATAQYRFDRWTTDNGLPQSSIHAILQTRDGYSWLTTWDGLVRFDGVRFTVFNRNNSPGINANRFTSLYEDPDGALWIGTDAGGVIRYRQGTFTGYAPRRGLSNSNWVKGITGDEAGHLWVLFGNQVMQWADERFLPAAVNNFPNNPWVQFSVIQRENRGGFWSQTQTGLALFVRGRVATRTRQDGLPSLNVSAVAEDQTSTRHCGSRPPRAS